MCFERAFSVTAFAGLHMQASACCCCDVDFKVDMVGDRFLFISIDFAKAGLALAKGKP